MAILFLTGEDVEEINKQMQIVAGKVAELEVKLDALIKELQAERKPEDKK